MAINVIRGTNKKPVSSGVLGSFFENLEKHQETEGQLFLGYPIMATSEGRYAIDAIWLSPQKGIIIFDLVEGHDIGDYQENQDEAANFLEAKLKLHSELVHRRKLLIPIQTVSFAPAILTPPDDKEYIILKADNLENSLSELDDWESTDSEIYQKTLSAIQNISTIRKNKTKRKVEKHDSRGAKLKNLEDSIATLDSQQGKAVVETVEGVQRIRGLAGSGKTIVLALKAAYLHAQHPDWRIAITFNTRSLKGQFERLINTFCIEQTGEEPDWENLRIINAWGAPGGKKRDGLYHEFCRVHDLPYSDFGSAKRFGRGNEFAGVCEDALNAVKTFKNSYDAILVDEAQDFPATFLKLCYEFLTNKKRLVYAYDELQNLSGQSLPHPEQIFGVKQDGSPKVRFTDAEPGKPKNDLLLHKCYRNSRSVLTTAHALGFGIYRPPHIKGETGLVQMFDHPGLWEDVGYKVKTGSLEEGKNVILERTAETSPTFLENHSSIDDLIQFKSFQTEEEQTNWLINSIQENLNGDELRHDDIMVINPDPLTTRNKIGPIRKYLYELGIGTHIAGVDTNPDVFFRTAEQSITFTGIFRAKGNEAGMVYIINAQDCHSSMYNLSKIRNRLFTAITRSKAWVRVLGIGPAMDSLSKEFNELKMRNFELNFRYPTEPERKKLKIIHRDMTEEEKKKLEKRKKGISGILQDLEDGKINKEDIDKEALEKLKKLLF